MGFTRVRRKAKGGLDGSFRQIQSRGSVVVALFVKSSMGLGQQTPGEEELRIMGDRLIQEARGLRQFFPGVNWIRHVTPQLLGLNVQIVRGEVPGGDSLNLRFLARRNLDLELIGNRFGNFALDREDIR